MGDKTKVNFNGIGFFEALTVLFVGLKLTNFISWSWWWVLSPVLFKLGVIILFGSIFAGILGAVYMKGKGKKR